MANTWQAAGWDDHDPSSWGFFDRVYAHEEGLEGVHIADIRTEVSDYELDLGPADTAEWWYERLSAIHRAECAWAETDDDGKQRVREDLGEEYAGDPLIYDTDVDGLADRARRIIAAVGE